MKPVLIVLFGFFIYLDLQSCYANARLSDREPRNVCHKLKEFAEPLSAKQQSIVIISAFTANGNLTGLRNAVENGLDAGLTISEVKEIIVQLYAYAGFPRSLNALNVLMQAQKDRKARGVNDVSGKAASPYPANKTRLEFGTENQTRLVGSPVKGEVYEFAPVIDQFLKEHLFGDIFGRDVLDYQTREIVTISALASIGGTDNQLRSHFRVGMHNGLTKDQLRAIVLIIRDRVGEIEGNKAEMVLQSVQTPDTGINATAGKANQSNSNFVGSVYVAMIVTPDSVFNTQMASVTFETRARTNWHYHPSGQILVITDGTAYYQEKGKLKQVFSKGQVIKCAPNVHHWHGATPDGPMTHTALNPNVQAGAVVWLQPVTTEEYQRRK